MLSKCANPSCSAPFLYLSKGKLFRMETAASGNQRASTFGMDPSMKKNARHLEFFWLCKECADAVTLIYSKGHGVVTRPLARACAKAAAAVSSS